MRHDPSGWRRFASILATITALSSVSLLGLQASAASSTVSLSPITANFVQSQFTTHYSVFASDTAGHPLTYKWSLKLQLIDKSGAANPGLPGSHAAVDPGCNNHGKLTSSATTFAWQHGDASLGNCDHTKMGHSGHQGRITLVVSDGVWSCTTSYNGTNTGVGKGVTCTLIKGPSAKVTAWKCQGSTTKLVDNSNGGGVTGGGKPPSFLTKGVSYCVMQLITYHWNNGLGKTPGTIGLAGTNGIKVGTWKAKGSSGQGGAKNVNWTAAVSTTSKPVVINGVYSCVDSDPATWSQDSQTHGTGFCQVYVEKAVPVKTTTTTKAPIKKKPTTTTTVKKATAAKCSGTKLSIKATPNAGKPPLEVTFALCSPKSVQWRIDYGDGTSKVAIGSPPKSIVHSYRRVGDYLARLTTISSQNATASSSATAVVSVQTAPLISLVPTPSSGAAPLHVVFALSTSVTHITTWSLDFGDGTHTGGGGKPPASVSHTYAKDGSYKATFAVKPGAYALDYTVAQVTVGSGTPPILGVIASPSSGTHPLAVRFTIGTTIPGVISSWVMKFGDGYQQSGRGKPPTSVTHTYAKKGVFLAVLLVAQQQTYGGVQYDVPRNGLVIQVK
jgi:PKD repeat protein